MNEFIYEYIEDFQSESTETLKKDIISDFCERLWESLPTKKRKRRYVHFAVASSIKAEYRDVFERYSNLYYEDYVPFTPTTDYFVMLKQRLINLYEIYCDQEVCKSKNYMSLILKPRQVYFEFFNHQREDLPTPEELNLELLGYVVAAEKVKDISSAQKVKFTWAQYKRFVEEKMYAIFTNYKQRTWDNAPETLMITDYVDDDHVAMAYISRCLGGYLKNERYAYLGVRRNHKLIPCPNCGLGVVEEGSGVQKCILCRSGYKPLRFKDVRCVDCGTLFAVGSKSRMTKRCPKCQREHRKKTKAISAAKRRQNAH